MKAALMREYHRPLELVERPVPEPVRHTDVLVRVGGAGVCATDLHAIDGLMEPAGVTLPLVLGHENAGLGGGGGRRRDDRLRGRRRARLPALQLRALRRLPSRQRHALRPPRLHRPDGRRRLRRVRARLGALADRAAGRCRAGRRRAARGRRAHRVPRGADGSRTSPFPASTAVLIGVGGVGHIALQLLRELGSSSVITIDTDERRRRLAAELGADEVIDGSAPVDAVRELTGGRGADLVFDFVGTDETHAAAAAMLARGGTYSVIGYGGTVAIPSVALVANEQAVVGNLVGTWVDLWELLQLHAAGRIVLKTETHPLDSVNDVLDKLREGEVTGRAVLVPG